MTAVNSLTVILINGRNITIDNFNLGGQKD